MMREILFRGKRTDTGEWVEGDLLSNAFFMRETGKNCCCIADYSNMDYSDFNDVFEQLDDFEVDPETVGQYTGLKDSTGKRIFEGDIVKEKCHNLIFVVVWSEESLCYSTKRIDGGKDYLCDFWDCDVVGNRWDNPELLEAQG